MKIAKKSCQKILKPTIVIGMCTIATISMGCYMLIVKNITIKTSEIIKILPNHVIKNRNMVKKMKIGMMNGMMNGMKIGLIGMKIGKINGKKIGLELMNF